MNDAARFGLAKTNPAEIDEFMRARGMLPHVEAATE
jgi:hypothetical protein